MRNILFAACLLIVFTVRFTAQDNPFYASSYLNSRVFNSPPFLGVTDTISGSWSFIASLSQPLFGVNAYYWQQNDKVFICGGATANVIPTPHCRWYNVSTNTYEPADSLPQGRWGGKMVRVRDSLYLVGSVDSSFSSADGLIFRYSLSQNSWLLKDTMPQPFVHESAVCVINDSLILTIGGSTNSFLSPTAVTRIYNPWNDTWRTLSSSYPVNVTTAHADYTVSDSNRVIVLGGYNAGNLDAIYKGTIRFIGDTTRITWSLFGSTLDSLFGLGVYRVAGARWNDYMLFGPAMNGANALNMLFGLKLTNDSVFSWSRFLPNTIDTVGNISTYGVKAGADTNYFFLFGGFKNPNVVSTAQKFTFATPPPPIGINIISHNIPQSFKLYQNYPNPFNPVTKIRFDIPNVGATRRVALTVFDILGREIAALVNEVLPPGSYGVSFDGSNLSSGIYYLSLRTESFSDAKKMILIK